MTPTLCFLSMMLLAKCATGRNPMLITEPGEEAPKHSHPYQALMAYEDLFICGGSLVSDRHVITAAHCFWYFPPSVNFSSVNFYFGKHLSNVTAHEPGQQQRGLSKVYEYPIREGLNENDLAVVLLSEPVTFSESVQPIPLINATATIGKSDIPGAASRTYDVSGWGQIVNGGRNSPVLRYAIMSEIPWNKCERQDHVDTLFCAIGTGKFKNASACHGDSGGPAALILNGQRVLAGIVHAGNSEHPNCAVVDTFTNVALFRKWIDEKMAISE